MNDKAIRILEFDKILQRLSSFAQSDLGRQRCMALRPESDPDLVLSSLSDTEEAATVLSYTGMNPMHSFGDIRPSLSMAAKGACLSPEALMHVAWSLQAAAGVRSALVTERENTPHITGMASLLQGIKPLRESIETAIIGENEIADQASPELSNIRRHIRVCNERIRDKLNSMAHGTSFSKYLQDSIITLRNGRYVLAVRQEYRQNVPGLVHDQSSSGATLYIEPMAVVELGNEIKEWQAKEKAEIERILTALSGQVADHQQALETNIEVMTELDFIFAKACLAKDMNAVLPKLNVKNHLKLIRARHPLIDPEKVVPLDFWIGDEFSTLVITGPNTGGKTVTLKTIGLITLMAQAGLHIPASFGSEVAVFEEVFADIGDEQSIEQSLSTFSSHMTNIVEILSRVMPRDLVLFDELGAGTDPTEGAALAQAILQHLTEKKITAIATTHYSELKAYALSTRGVENASVEFDVATLRPTYRLSIGVPGKSNAFEISRKLGLSSALIDSAKQLISHESAVFEDVIANAEYHRQVAEKEQALAEEARRESIRLRNETEELHRQARELQENAERKAREKARGIVEKARREADQLLNSMREVKKNASFQEASALKRRLDKQADEYSDGLQAAQIPSAPPESLSTGDRVLVTTLNAEGDVISVGEGGSVQVQVGVMKMTCDINSLRLVKKAEKKLKTSFTAHVDMKHASVGMSHDVRGMALEEAIAEVDNYLDEAGLAGLHEVTIVHGKGTGILRQGIQKHLKKHPNVKSFRTGIYGEGEDGVTVVTLK